MVCSLSEMYVYQTRCDIEMKSGNVFSFVKFEILEMSMLIYFIFFSISANRSPHLILYAFEVLLVTVDNVYTIYLGGRLRQTPSSSAILITRKQRYNPPEK